MDRLKKIIDKWNRVSKHEFNPAISDADIEWLFQVAERAIRVDREVEENKRIITLYLPAFTTAMYFIAALKDLRLILNSKDYGN